MHYHCEIILPLGTGVEASIKTVMDPYYEGREVDHDSDDDDGLDKYAFWDWYVIGGRFAGDKLISGLDKAKIDEFYKWCEAEHVTVSGLQCGKQKLAPETQIPKVDAKWREMFPSEEPGRRCPLFAHANDQYGHAGMADTLAGDVARLGDSLNVTCARVIFAGPSYNPESGKHDGPLKAVFMLAEDAWNGCNHMPVAWDRTVRDALAQYQKRLTSYKDEYRQLIEPHDDWLCVTVDYHS